MNKSCSKCEFNISIYLCFYFMWDEFKIFILGKNINILFKKFIVNKPLTLYYIYNFLKIEFAGM